MNPERTKEADEFLNKLFKLRWLSKKHLAEELTSFQITPAQYAALKLLLDEPEGMKMSTLAKQAHQVSATMTGIIDRLEMQELVQRNRLKSDRRNVSVQITEKGKQLINRILAAKKIKFQEILEQLSDDQKAQLFSSIDTAIDYFSDNLRGNS
jgi:DNA-binding MarR family transcriptional regulator